MGKYGSGLPVRGEYHGAWLRDDAGSAVLQRMSYATSFGNPFTVGSENHTDLVAADRHVRILQWYLDARRLPASSRQDVEHLDRTI